MKRVCFSTSILGATIAMGKNLSNKVLHVYMPDDVSESEIYKPSLDEVPDSNITKEVWVKKAVKLKYVKTIKVTSAIDQPFTYKYGDKEAETYGWNFEDYHMKPVSESSGAKDKMYPVYVLLTHTGTVLSNTIRSITKNPYSHSSISFDPELDNMYSFGRKYKSNPLIGTFVKENIKAGLFEDVSDTATYSLYVTFVNRASYIHMRKRVKEFEDPNRRYRYNFIGLIQHQMGIESTREDAYFCSQFVDTILKEGDIEYFDRHSSLVKPYDFAKNQHFYHVKRGNLINYDAKSAELKTAEIARRLSISL